MIIADTVASLFNDDQKDLLLQLEQLNQYTSEDVKYVTMTIHLKSNSMEVTITAELFNEWGGTSGKRVMWVKGKVEQSFITDVTNEFNKWSMLPRNEKMQYGFMIQKHSARFKDGQIIDPLGGILMKDIQQYTNLDGKDTQS